MREVSGASTDDFATSAHDVKSDVALQEPVTGSWKMGRSRIFFSHARRPWEAQSSCPIFVLSLAFSRRSSSNDFFCSSAVHSSKCLARPWLLPLKSSVITFCVNVWSKSSFFLGFKLGSLLKSSHASSFLAWKRCFSSTRVLQNSRLRRSSSDLLLTCFLSHRRVVLAHCFNKEDQCLFQHGGGLLCARGRPRSHCSEASCGVVEASLSWERFAGHWKQAARGHAAAQ